MSSSESGKQPAATGWKRSPIGGTPLTAPTNVPLATATLPASPRDPAYERCRQVVHAKLVDTLHTSAKHGQSAEPTQAEVLQLLDRLIESEAGALARPERVRLRAELVADVLGLGPLEPLLQDPTVSDILVNGPFEVFVDRRGVLQLTDVTFRDTEHLMQVIDRIVSSVGRRVDESSAMVDARLADGSRVNAIVPPLSLRGPVLSIRRFGSKPLRLEDLLQFQMFAPEMASLLEAAVHGRLNIIIRVVPG